MKKYSARNILMVFSILISIVLLTVPAHSEWYEDPLPSIDDGKYGINELIATGHSVFGTTSEGLATLVEAIFSAKGRPNAYIVGEEASAAFIGGLTYGEGIIHSKTEPEEKIYWQGPSIGFDMGADGSRVMILVYNLDDRDDLYGRFPGGAGTAYTLAGLGGSFHTHSNGIILATIKTGAGLRLGANISYIKFSEKPKWLPF